MLELSVRDTREEGEAVISTLPHTAVHGRHYADFSETIALGRGGQTIHIQTYPFSEPKGPVRFYVQAATQEKTDVVEIEIH